MPALSKTDVNEIKTIPLSNRLIKAIHKILLSNVRGRYKSPGEFRISQNWIDGTKIDNAIFIPPSSEHVLELMSDLEKFLHNIQISIPHLVRIAIAHYQFETIHPFLDGNGRVGRLLITLYLVSNKILDKPLLYPSEYFERHKSLYYERLTQVREKNDLAGWIDFFIIGIRETAEKAILTLQEILTLKEKIIVKKIVRLGRKTRVAQKLVIFIFKNPVLSIKDVLTATGLSSYTAASNLVKDFVNLKILQENIGDRVLDKMNKEKRRRNRLFFFKDYLELLPKL